MRKVGKHEDSIEALAVSPDNSFVVACDGTLAMRWSTTSAPTVMVHEPAARVAVSPDGTWIAIGTPSGGLVRADVATNEARTLRPHSDMDGGVGLQSLAISPDGRRVALAGGQDTVEILDADDGHRLWAGRTQKYPYAVRWRGDDLVVGGWDGGLYVVDAASIAAGIDQLPEHGSVGMPVFDVAVAGDRIWAVTGSETPIVLWDITQTSAIASVAGEHGIHAVSFSPDGHTFAAGGNDQAVAIYARDSLEKLGSITIITPGDDSAGSDVRDYYDATGPATVRALAFAPDGTKVYVGLQDGRLIELAVNEIIAGGIANIAMYEAQMSRALVKEATSRTDIVVPPVEDAPKKTSSQKPAAKKSAAKKPKPKRIVKKAAAKKPSTARKASRNKPVGHKGTKAQRAMGAKKPVARKKLAAKRKPASKKPVAKKPTKPKPKAKRR